MKKTIICLLAFMVITLTVCTTAKPVNSDSQQTPVPAVSQTPYVWQPTEKVDRSQFPKANTNTLSSDEFQALEQAVLKVNDAQLAWHKFYSGLGDKNNVLPEESLPFKNSSFYALIGTQKDYDNIKTNLLCYFSQGFFDEIFSEPYTYLDINNITDEQLNADYLNRYIIKVNDEYYADDYTFGMGGGSTYKLDTINIIAADTDKAVVEITGESYLEDFPDSIGTFYYIKENGNWVLDNLPGIKG